MEMEFTQIVDYTHKIVTCLTKLRKKVKGVENSQRASGSSNDWRATAVKAKVKLPKLELIKFNGNRKNWQAFYGSAAIQGLQPTAQCYADAIDLLQQRFAKQEALVYDHMKSLMDIQKVPLQGNARTLRRLHDSLQAHIWGLRALGVGEESYCAMLYPLLLRALPKNMSLDYNRKMSLEDTKNATAVTGTSPESPTENVHLRALRTLLKFI
ncbi:uncharacterized protein LOC120842531 [Ixodes scapularis]|uniref:uncharacterized protein LOC120842531 n=1 Tax=Ixodes scapularis TaxID=6945 RepID=UPI001A9D24AF|nr:uncharacterized protein LOC120842531 [Ixodes scapularis]